MEIRCMVGVTVGGEVLLGVGYGVPPQATTCAASTSTAICLHCEHDPASGGSICPRVKSRG